MTFQMKLNEMALKFEIMMNDEQMNVLRDIRSELANISAGLNQLNESMKIQFNVGDISNEVIEEVSAETVEVVAENVVVKPDEEQVEKKNVKKVKNPQGCQNSVGLFLKKKYDNRESIYAKPKDLWEEYKTTTDKPLGKNDFIKKMSEYGFEFRKTKGNNIYDISYLKIGGDELKVNSITVLESVADFGKTPEELEAENQVIENQVIEDKNDDVQTPENNLFLLMDSLAEEVELKKSPTISKKVKAQLENELV